MDAEIVTLRGNSTYRFSRALELVTGQVEPDGSVRLWIQEWKPRFQIHPLRVRHGDSVRTASHAIRVVEINAVNVRPYVRLEVIPVGVQSLLTDSAATRASSQPTMM